MFPRALAVGLAVLIGISVNQGVPFLWLSFLLPVLAIGVAAGLRDRRFWPVAVLALPVVPLPLFVPILLPVGGKSLFVLDAVLVIAALWALRGTSPSHGADRSVAFYALVMTALCFVGLLRGAQMSAVIQDFRGPIYIVCGYVVASRRLTWADRDVVIRTVSAILWWSVAAITFVLLTGQEFLHGRVGQTAAFLGGDRKEQLDAVRFLIASKELSLLTALVVIGMLLLGARSGNRRGVLFGLLVPAIFVVFMGFSRQSIAATAVALVFLMVVAPRRAETVTRIGAGLAGLALLLGVLALTGATSRLTAEGTVVGDQITAYSDRVFAGLFGDNVTEDPGNQFRTLEADAAIDFAVRHPVAGGGLGTQYRGDLELEAFQDVEYGRRYVHNVYLWYAAHGGIVGLVALGGMMLRPMLFVVLPAFRRDSWNREGVLALGGAHIALLTIGVVEPVIHLNATAPLTGALLAVFAHVGAQQRLADRDAIAAAGVETSAASTHEGG